MMEFGQIWPVGLENPGNAICNLRTKVVIVKNCRYIYVSSRLQKLRLCSGRSGRSGIDLEEKIEHEFETSPSNLFFPINLDYKLLTLGQCFSINDADANVESG